MISDDGIVDTFGSVRAVSGQADATRRACVARFGAEPPIGSQTIIFITGCGDAAITVRAVKPGEAGLTHEVKMPGTWGASRAWSAAAN